MKGANLRMKTGGVLGWGIFITVMALCLVTVSLGAGDSDKSQINNRLNSNKGPTDGQVGIVLPDTIQWQECPGGSRKDVAWSIQQAPDGGFIVAGQTSSSDGDVSHYYGGPWDA
jgi:hypothetical protein